MTDDRRPETCEAERSPDAFLSGKLETPTQAARKVTVTITERRPRLVGSQLVDGDCHPFGVIGYGLEERGGLFHKKSGRSRIRTCDRRIMSPELYR